jgi:hypothetical protein
MTKAELIAFLEKVPDDAVFLVSSDEEGNSYRPADAALEKGILEGRVWDTVHPDDIGDTYLESELTDVVVFW